MQCGLIFEVMQILFLCSSLEPMRDGVGDYALALAEECCRQGHSCSMIALHDRHIQKASEVEHVSDHFSIPSLRLPSLMPWPERISKARAFRSRFQPDWISLQFVPYGFSDKGIVKGLSRHLLALLGGDSLLHIMFHELWIGEAKGAPFKHRVIGAIQRRFICSMIKELKPDLIHTHTPVYQNMLRLEGYKASILPLFGSIAIVEPGGLEWMWQEAAAAGCHVNAQNRGAFWLGGFFGTLYSQWKPEPFFSILRNAAKIADKKVCLVAMGRLRDGEDHWNSFARKYAGDFCFLKLGVQSSERVSEFLQSLDFGIAVSPWGLLGKSSTAAAMIDHGLPVIVTRDDFFPTYPFTADESSADSLFYRCDDQLPIKLAAGLPRREPCSRIKEIAAMFTGSLGAVAPGK